MFLEIISGLNRKSLGDQKLFNLMVFGWSVNTPRTIGRMVKNILIVRIK